MEIFFSNTYMDCFYELYNTSNSTWELNISSSLLWSPSITDDDDFLFNVEGAT